MMLFPPLFQSFSAGLSHFIHILLHLNLYLGEFLKEYGSLTYVLLFLIIFCETGLVITPFLPGDSLLFAAGGLFAAHGLNIYFLILLLICAAFLGDNTNYVLGRFLGRTLVQRFFGEHHKVLKLDYLHRTENFYKKYGFQAIIIARFIPIIRTFCPFIAGLASMPYLLFASISFFAAGLWVSLVTYVGYEFGNIPWIKSHFSGVILLIIILSISPIIFKIILKKIHRHKAPKTET
jgi:membrane-associated protein